MRTTPLPADIVAVSGGTVADVLIGNIAVSPAPSVGSISGVKFNDLNGDGIQQDNEPGASGWTVFLDTNDNLILDPGERSTVTNGGGNYSFTGLAPGTYRVREVVQAGWFQTTVDPEPIAIMTGTHVADVNFGNFRLVTISGTLFHDLNANGVRDAGEPGLSGWTVFLDANNNGILDAGEISTVTNGGGGYSFNDLGPGTYRVRLVPQSGWQLSTPLPADILASSGTNVSGLDLGVEFVG
jgi:hypothetical protein